ncbi:nuclear pore complex protein NUP43 isoform X1 [Tripterygium wilfordii]|uniref:nuclear pore complex protein NUP43 isoform X1 n=1 Tax=Tripterygium wilfordii TaxID=458696 RepID=UPI0018F81866|nr:nuclear pore complex protein NUP43 isoform X1 [Tripterygium wilfordii]
MAISGIPQPPEIHRIPQRKYVDTARWLPSVAAFDKYAVVALFDSDNDSSAVEIHSFKPNPSPILTPRSSWTPPSRISSLVTSQSSFKPLIAAASYGGSLHILSCRDSMVEGEMSVRDGGFHVGPVSGVDLTDDGAECVSVGDDGRVNLVKIGGDSSKLSYRRVFDSNGLVSYTAVKWASPSEFVTGGFGFSLQWWDQRKPGSPASQFKGSWSHCRSQGKTSGIIHSIDIHSSRKHTCLAGGSSGMVFAWDLRWQKEPIVLSGVGTDKVASHSLSESEVWEVHFDCYTKSSNISNFTSPQILPAMICSEDGILAVAEQGEEPIELLAEPCAINSFDIDRHNPSDIICSLEWESIAILTRS